MLSPAVSDIPLPTRNQDRVRLHRIEAQFTALRYFALGGTDHATHEEQASMICRCIIWRNNHDHDQRLRRVVARANVAGHGPSSTARR